MSISSEMVVFVNVVKTESFSEAGRELGMTASAVSKLIGRLEDRLGAKLFVRTTRRVMLTDEGRTYFHHCIPILSAIDNAELAVAEFQNEPRGQLKVAIPIGLGQYHILPLMTDLIERYPNLRIKTILTDCAINLGESQIDVAVRIGQQPDSSLMIRKLGSTRRIVVASPAYLERHGMPKTPHDLKNHNCLRQTEVTDLNKWEFHGPNGSLCVEANGRFEVNNTPALHRSALAGNGLIRVGDFIVGADINAGHLVQVLGDYEPATKTEINAVYLQNRHLSPKVRAFIDTLVDNFLPHPPWELAAS